MKVHACSAVILMALAAAVLCFACSSGSGDGPGPDAYLDARDASDDAGPLDGADTGADVVADADSDAGGDAGLDAGSDAGPAPDAGTDAGHDAGPLDGADAGLDAGSDAGLDAGTDAGTDAGADGGQEEHVPYCWQVCSTPADCAQQYPPWDEDNYSCEDGICRYDGCNSDAECQGVPGMESYLCRPSVYGDAPVCVMSCGQAADCSQGMAPYNEDNYACEDGACRYTGCNSDEECQAVATMESYTCRVVPPVEVAQCMPGCASVTDCDLGSAAYDQDNYDCEDGLCVYTGCNSDQECSDSIPTYETTCR